MKILFICEEYPPGRNGGIGTMVKTLSKELVKLGHQVYIVGLYAHGYGQKNFEIDHNIKVWRFRRFTDIGLISNNFSLKDKLLLKFLKATYLYQLDAQASYKKLFKFISLLIQKEKIDIIEAQDWNAFLQERVPIYMPRFNIPVVVKFNGSYTYFRNELGLESPESIRNAEAKHIMQADALSSVSKYTALETSKLFGLKQEIQILYNSIDLPEKIEEHHVQNKLIFTGTLIYKKGIFSLLKAWNIVCKHRKDFILEIYGKGNIELLKKEIDANAQKNVDFKGHVSQDELFSTLKSSYAAIFPSYSECFALAPLEAMAVGCPVIYTSKSSGKELISDGINGILINPENPEQIAAKILQLFGDRLYRDKLSLASRKTIEERFSIKQSAIDHIAFYSKIIKRYKSKECEKND